MTADQALAAIQLQAKKPTNEVGPKGGNLNNPDQHPQWRTESFNGSIEHGLHRFSKDTDSATGGVKNEQPWHRMAAYMLNAGRTNSEIAMAAGVRPDEVSLLKQQRWFQELCATIANTDGEDLLGLLRSEAAESITTLVKLRDFADSESIQLSAARTLLEQAHGKPIQKIISDVTTRRPKDPKEEMNQLTEELAALRDEGTYGRS
jgi:hypothetical protein